MKRVILLQIIYGFLNKTVICDFLNLCCPEGSIYTQIVSPNQVKSEWITGFIGREKGLIYYWARLGKGHP